jgi:hypothetical protein
LSLKPPSIKINPPPNEEFPLNPVTLKLDALNLDRRTSEILNRTIESNLLEFNEDKFIEDTRVDAALSQISHQSSSKGTTPPPLETLHESGALQAH